MLVKITNRAQVLSREGAAYNTWEDLNTRKTRGLLDVTFSRENRLFTE